MDIAIAKKIMGKNFIGPSELEAISARLGIPSPLKIGIRIPAIPFAPGVLKKNRGRAILILGMPKLKNGKALTVNSLRTRFGLNPQKAEPCFYNQDWYLKEKFASQTLLKFQWYLISKNVASKTRGQNPPSIKKALGRRERFPSAVLATFVFFAFYFHTHKEKLWQHDFIWCADYDSNGDQIYVGRYQDPIGISKNGFSIHRYLHIRSCYGSAPEITS